MTFFDYYASIAQTPEAIARIEGFLDGRGVPEGIAIDQDRRWTLVQRARGRGPRRRARAHRAEAKRDPTTTGTQNAYAARAAFPDLASKRAFWSDFHAADRIPFTSLREAAASFHDPNHPELSSRSWSPTSPTSRRSTGRRTTNWSRSSSSAVPAACSARASCCARAASGSDGANLIPIARPRLARGQRRARDLHRRARARGPQRVSSRGRPIDPRRPVDSEPARSSSPREDDVMITVYVFGNAPAPVRNVTRDLRALWALEESGLPYRLQPLDFARGELKQPRVRADQPVRKDSVDRRRRIHAVRIGSDRALRRREGGPAAPGDARGPRARHAVGVRGRQHRRARDRRAVHDRRALRGPGLGEGAPARGRDR